MLIYRSVKMNDNTSNSKTSTELIKTEKVLTNGNDIHKEKSTKSTPTKNNTPEKTVNCYW